MKLTATLKKISKSLKLNLKLNKVMRFLKSKHFMVILAAVLGFFIFKKFTSCGAVEGFTSKPSTFESDVSSGKKLVWFYADWCGHCKSMKTEWDTASSKVDGKMVKINLGDSKDSKVEEISKKYNIQGFPTILLLDNGEIQETYEGERKASDFESFVNDNC